MDLSYHPRPFTSGWDRHMLLNGRSLAILAATAFWVAALSIKSGIVVALCTAAGGLVLGLVLRSRAARVAVLADAHQVRSIGWGSELAWPWDTIAQFDYVPHRWRCTPTSFSIGTFYTGRVTLSDGTTHLIPALIGSSTGARQCDDVNLQMLRDLSTELARHQSAAAV